MPVAIVDLDLLVYNSIEEYKNNNIIKIILLIIN